jgi:hypothetical protein
MSFKGKFLTACLVSGLIICGGFTFAISYHKIVTSIRDPKPFIPSKCKDCNSYFYDGIYTHEKAYRKEGIKPQKKFEDLEKLKQQGILDEVEDNEFFFISELDHSRPFLLKKACTFLNELGVRYKQNCDNNGLQYKRFKITSLTRCTESVKKLQKVNAVAIEHSAHLKGKTFDISYTHFGNNTAQLTEFINALDEARKEGKCYVKYEESTGCLHITVI